MQIPCFIQPSIFTPYVWILSNDLDFSKPNFVTKIPKFRSSKGPNKKCFFIRELQMRKLFHWHYVFTQTWYLEQEPKWALPKIFARCAEIMRCDEIRWFDGINFLLVLRPGELSRDKRILKLAPLVRLIVCNRIPGFFLLPPVLGFAHQTQIPTTPLGTENFGVWNYSLDPSNKKTA